jgi:ABC-type xylose transport system permease subunit
MGNVLTTWHGKLKMQLLNNGFNILKIDGSATWHGKLKMQLLNNGFNILKIDGSACKLRTEPCYQGHYPA